MRKILGILILCAIIAISATFQYFFRPSDAIPNNPGLQDAILSYVSEDMKLLKQDEINVKRLELAKERALLNTAIANIPRNSALRFWSIVAVIGSACVTLLIVGSGVHRAMVKARQVHEYQIGGNVIVIHERDLSVAGPVALGLMNAEQLKQMNGGIERAFEIYTTMADVQTQQLRALIGKHHTIDIAALPAPAEENILTPAGTGTVPTFQKLLHTGELAPGKPMILGYDQGKARAGSFLDIYSSAIAGESGSGKTSTMLFLIGSGLICQGVRFLGIDPHYPHPNSLGYKTRPLWEAGLMEMATNKVAMEEVCEAIETTIDNRLAQIDTDTTPVVLVIDELAFLSKTAFGKRLAHTMERISTEGRKCQVYMLASSQTWLSERTGGSSVVRDTLTSAYVHRIKPKQANLLLQDKEEAEKVKKHVKKPGQVLFLPVNDESAVVEMPLTTEDDMVYVANMLQPVTLTRPVNVTPINQSINLTKTGDESLINLVNEQRKDGDLERLAELCQVSKPFLSNVLNHKKPMSAKVRDGFTAYLAKGNVIPFPGGREGR